MEHSRKLALIIGVDQYIYFPKITLEYTKKDAISISEILKKRGFDKVIELHEDVEEQKYTPIRGNILERMNEICGEVGSDDLLLVYFSGHGHREKENGDELLLGKPLLLPSDLCYQKKPVKRGKKEDIIRYEKKIIEDTAIPIADVISLMNDSPARQKILIIDACFAGIDLDNLAADLGQLFRDATGSPGSPKTNDDSSKVADEGKKR